MGIFDVVSKKKNAEEAVMQALVKNELLDLFIEQIQMSAMKMENI